MARFKYMGEPTQSWVQQRGPFRLIRTPLKNGSYQNLTPVPPATEFVVGQDIGHDITDPMSLLAFRSDSRYQEITP